MDSISQAAVGVAVMGRRLIMMDNLTPADIFYGRGRKVLDRREQIKDDTRSMRRKMYIESKINQPNDTLTLCDLAYIKLAQDNMN